MDLCDAQKITFFNLFYPQGVWGSHFFDVSAEYVHPISGEGALWLRHVCANSSGVSGGKR